MKIKSASSIACEILVEKKRFGRRIILFAAMSSASPALSRESCRTWGGLPLSRLAATISKRPGSKNGRLSEFHAAIRSASTSTTVTSMLDLNAITAEVGPYNLF